MTFLLIGLATGLVVGGAVSFRFRGELDDLRGELAASNAERDALVLECDVAEARLSAAERRLAARARDRWGAEDAGPPAAETPAQKAARAKAEAERAAKVDELMRLLADPGGGGATAGAGEAAPAP